MTTSSKSVWKLVAWFVAVAVLSGVTAGAVERSESNFDRPKAAARHDDSGWVSVGLSKGEPHFFEKTGTSSCSSSCCSAYASCSGSASTSCSSSGCSASCSSGLEVSISCDN